MPDTLGNPFSPGDGLDWALEYAKAAANWATQADGATSQSESAVCAQVALAYAATSQAFAAWAAAWI